MPRGTDDAKRLSWAGHSQVRAHRPLAYIKDAIRLHGEERLASGEEIPQADGDAACMVECARW
jgi:hypothetical protein